MMPPELEEATTQARQALDVWTGCVEDQANGTLAATRTRRLPDGEDTRSMVGDVPRSDGTPRYTDRLDDMTYELFERVPWVGIVVEAERDVRP